MYKTVLNSLFAVFLFALGAVGAWYILQQNGARTAQQAVPPAAPSRLAAVAAPPQHASPSLSAEAESQDRLEGEMPIPLHAKSMSAEDLFRYGAMNRASLESLRQREEELRKEELRLQLVQKDIEGQKREVEGILTQSQHAVKAAEDMLLQVQQQQQALVAEKQQRQSELEEIRRTKETPDADKQTNTKKMAELLGSMKAEDAAEVLKNLADKGNTDYVLRLLDNIEQRDAAKILDALGNPELVADLTEGYQELKRAENKRNRR